ncbi:MAG: AAA family ATPase [Desulfurellaceae bacterium]|nr:AAA family ATPase [Desulfurellaceae bacterium]
MGEEGAQSRFEVALESGLSPLVGRTEELAFLQQRWETARVREGQVVLLGGEPGIGKSRLVQELKEQVAKAGEARREFRCSSYARNTAFYSVIDHLQRWLQFQGDEPADEKFRRLETALEGYRHLPEESVALFASLLSLPLPERFAPLRLSPERQRQKTQEALVAWLAEESEERPLLIVWEDLHWVDPSTLDLVQMLIERAAPLHLFVLLVFRSSEFTPPWPPRPPVHLLTLNRLERRPVEDLIAHVAQGQRLPQHLVEHIAAQTDGVPLFVEELTRTIIEAGLPENGGGGAPSAIPATLQDSLMARLDQLSSIARDAAQIGAVLGRAFSYTLIRAVWPSDEQRLARGLAQLVEAELIFQKGMLPQARWVFKHAMLQDTAYQSLLKSKRQQIHHHVANVLAKQFPDIRHHQPELVAHHYTEAGLLDQAIGFWQYAGEQAVQRSAHREGIGHFLKGLALLGELPETPDRTHRELTIQTRLGPSLMATKGYAAPEVERAYARAQELCQQLGETPQSFQVLRGLWVVHEMRAELKTARKLGEQLLALAQHLDDPDLLIEVHRALGNTLLWIGEFAHAREHLQKAIALHDPEQHTALAFQYGTDPRTVCLLYETLALWALGYPEQALQKSREALTRAEEGAHQHSLSLAAALNWTGLLHQLRGEAEVTHERAVAGIALAQQCGFPDWEMIGTIFRDWATAAQSHNEAPVEQLQKMIAAWCATGAELLRPYLLGLLAEQYGKIGRIEKGLALLDEALAVVNTSAEHFSEAELYRLRGGLLLVRDANRLSAQTSPPRSNSEAESCFQKALFVARQQGAKSWELRAATSLAQQWFKQGKRESARRVLTETADWFTEGRETRDFQAAQALLAELG